MPFSYDSRFGGYKIGPDELGGGHIRGPVQLWICFTYLYFLLKDLSQVGHLCIRSPTEWTSLRCLCILFRVVSTWQTIHFANWPPGTTVHKSAIILRSWTMRSFKNHFRMHKEEESYLPDIWVFKISQPLLKLHRRVIQQWNGNFCQDSESVQFF